MSWSNESEMNQIFEMALSRIGTFVGGAAANLVDYHEMMIAHFGQRMTAGIYLCAAILILVIFFKIFKLAFNLLRFVVVPALVAGYIASVFFSFNFLAFLPIAGAAFSLMFLIRA
jgi:hypothetical protein